MRVRAVWYRKSERERRVQWCAEVCMWGGRVGGVDSKFQTFQKCPIHACYCFIKTVSENVFGSTPLHFGIDSLNISTRKYCQGERKKDK